VLPLAFGAFAETVVSVETVASVGTGASEEIVVEMGTGASAAFEAFVVFQEIEASGTETQGAEPVAMSVLVRLAESNT
jgi:hypothetical protein